MAKRVPALLTLPFAGDLRPSLVQRDAEIAAALNDIAAGFDGGWRDLVGEMRPNTIGAELLAQELEAA